MSEGAAQEWLRAETRGVVLRIWVNPRAARDSVEGPHEGYLKVRLAAPPVDGAANEALVAMLAKKLRVPKRSLTLVHGETSRRKTLLLADLSAEEARARLWPDP